MTLDKYDLPVEYSICHVGSIVRYYYNDSYTATGISVNVVGRACFELWKLCCGTLVH